MSLFVVLEGIDGAGTTTLTTLLRQSLVDDGHSVHCTREPSDGPIGAMIRQALAHRLCVATEAGTQPLAWQTMALLFAADRIDHLQSEVEPALAAGKVVISDRYDHSSVAYQSTVGGGDSTAVQWVKSLNAHARRPDLVIVVDVDPQVALARRSQRGGSEELYEKQELQVKLAAFYRNIERYFDDKVVHVDGGLPLQEVAKQVVHAVRRVL